MSTLKEKAEGPEEIIEELNANNETINDEIIDEPAMVESAEELEDDDLTEKLKHYSTEANPFIHSIFPVLFVDKTMKIFYANEPCNDLFTGFFSLVGSYFIDIFGRAFEIEDIREIRETILTGHNSFTWKGKARIRSRNVATVETRVYLFPLEMSAKEEPTEFVVMFDDVTEENKRLLRSVFMSLLEASILKDNDTGKHIVRVNYYSKRLADEIFRCHNRSYNRIDADFIENIGFLASMHDVGKIGTPDDILNKEGPLSNWEWTIMREHTKNGAFILSPYPNPMAKEIALSHHEHWDGSGYPYQLSGEMIPLSARIVTLADVYDALRMPRPYKPPLSHGVTILKMREGKGKHFDPFLIDMFLNIAQDFNEIYEKNKDS